jgi:hypothetical protein
MNNLDRGALGDFLPVVQHDDPLDKFEDGPHDVFDPDQCDASLMNRMDEVHQSAGIWGGKSGEDFVKQEQAGLCGEGACDLQALALADPKTTGGLIGEPEQVRQS